MLSAVLGVWTQAVLAGTLGLSGAADAYFSALALSVFVTFIVNQTVVNRWVPELSQLLDPAQTPTRAFWSAGWRLTSRVSLIAIALGVALLVGADWVIGLVAPGLSNGSRDLAVASLRVMSLPLAIQLSGSGLIAVQYAIQGQPLIQASGALYSVSVAPSVLLLTPVLGPISAAVGAGVSYCLMFVMVLVGTLVVARGPVSSFEPPTFSTSHASVAVITIAGIVSFGQSLVGPMIASTLAPGTVAQLSFGYRPVEVLARGLPSVISYAVMPTLSAAYARGDADAKDAAVSDALRLTLVLMLPIAALLAAVREPLVTVLYQRSAFSIEAVQAVAPTLGWYAAALPAFSVVIVINVVFLAVRRERSALAMGIGLLASYALVGLVLGREFGGAGVALGFCVSNVFVALIGAAAAGRRNVSQLLSAGWFRWTLLGAGFALVVGSGMVELVHSRPAILQLAIASAVGGVGAVAGVIAAEYQSLRGTRAWLASRVLMRWRHLPRTGS